MFTVLNAFLKDERGAVTVDWVVLTASIVGLGALVIATIADGALDQSSGLNSYLQTADVTTSY